jgi:hypothetical protein
LSQLLNKQIKCVAYAPLSQPLGLNLLHCVQIYIYIAGE